MKERHTKSNLWMRITVFVCQRCIDILNRSIKLLQIIHPEARSTQTPSILVVVVIRILFKICKSDLHCLL